MNDAIVLLALSQLVCIGGIGYLYLQLQKLRAGSLQATRQRRPEPREPRYADAQAEAEARVPAARRGQQPPRRPVAPPAPAHRAYQQHAAAPQSPAALASQLTQMGLDIPALARRMNRSEEEVRLLLRRQQVAR